MKLHILSIVFLVFLVNNTFSAVYRVNNLPGIDADYSTFTAAHGAASANDTLYIESSHISYGTITISKPLTIIGTGYFIAINDSTQALPSTSRFTSITFNVGAQGSKLIGVHIEETITGTCIQVNTSDITIDRCLIINSSTSTSANTIRLANNLNNIVISRCFLHSRTTSTSTINCLLIGTTNTNIVVANNIILRSTTQTSTANTNAISMPTSSNALFINNVIFGNFIAYNSIVQNNIHARGAYTTSASFPNTTANNVSWTTSMGSANGNQISVNMTNVFDYAINGGTFNDDRFFKLRAGSPAIAAGVNGEDCGAYGGNDPYVSSGMPEIPSVFKAAVPVSATSTSGLTISIEAKTN